MLLLAGPLFFSCSNEFDPWGTEDDSELMTISVSQPGTRTSNDGNSTLWSEGDAISVIHTTTGGNTFWSSWFGFYGGNMFQGSVNRLSSSNDWYAVYPYVEENTAANEIHLDFPTRQVQVGNGNKSHFSGEQFPMFGKTKGVSRTDELSISMKNLLSAAEFKVTNTEDYPIVVKEIELTGPSYIAGSFKVDLTSDDPVLTAKSGSKTVRLVVTDGEAVVSGENALFYMAIAPFDIPAGGSFEIKVVAENASNPGTNIVYYHTFELASGTSFTSGLIKTINVSFDDDSSQNPDAGSAGEVELEVGEQPEDGVYLLVYKHGETSMAFAAFDEYKSQKYAIPVTVVDNQVLPQEGIDLSRFAITIENAGIEHPNDAGHDAYNVKNSEGKFIFHASGGSGDAYLRIQDTNVLMNSSTNTEVAYYHTFVQTADGVQILSSGSQSGFNQYLLAYTSANGFYYEQNNTGQKLHLYLLGGSAKEKQELAFSAERVEYDFDASGEGVLANAPTLTGAMTTVTYSSSDESVASVDADGNVTIHKAGTATITATAEADDFYYSATAQYLIVATTSAGTTFYRVTEFTAGEQYLIVSAGKALANNNGTIGATDVSASGDEVIVSDAASVMWTATASGSGFTLSNNGKYVQRGSGSSGKPSVGNAPSSTNYYIWTYDGTTSKMSTVSGTTYYLYYSNGWAQNSSSSSAGTVTIYSTTKPLTKQTLSFAQASVAWVIGEGYELNGSYAFPQTVTGNVTPVTYTSSNTSVATISGNRITIIATGSTTIKARTEGNDEYAPAEASYTLRINQKAPDGFVSLGTINLENSSVKNYLDNGTNDYTDDNYSSTSHIADYAPANSGWGGWGGGSTSSTRVDVPNPVSLDWGTASSGTATITVYNDQALTDEFWTWTATKGSTSYDIYNLIPGRTYYCTVVDDANSNYLYKATFNTEGRRRMLKVSDTVSQDNANNCRDLGGMITKDGTKRIKYGMIYRGTNLTATTTAEKKLLAEFMNIGLDNDLRDNGNINSASGSSSNRNNPFLNSDYPVVMYPNPVNSYADIVYCGPGYGTSIGGTTGSSLTNPDRVYETMMAFIDCAKRGKASYFHCYIGSDRTGYWGLVIEGLLGVSAKDCSIDFELTSFANSVTSGNRVRTSGTYADGMNYFKGKSYYSTFANDPDHQLQKTITKYLIDEVGISEADIETFKSLLLEDI